MIFFVYVCLCNLNMNSESNDYLLSITKEHGNRTITFFINQWLQANKQISTF